MDNYNITAKLYFELFLHPAIPDSKDPDPGVGSTPKKGADLSNLIIKKIIFFFKFSLQCTYTLHILNQFIKF